MAYYVITSDGGRFGPAEIGQLAQWAQEGRVVANTTIQDAAVGRTFLASELPGLGLGAPTLVAPQTMLRTPGASAAVLPEGTMAWAITAILFSAFVILVDILEISGVPFPKSAAQVTIDVPECIVAIYFIASSIGVLVLSRRGYANIVWAATMAVVLTLLDLMLNANIAQIVFSIIAFAYVGFLIRHMRSDKVKRAFGMA